MSRARRRVLGTSSAERQRPTRRGSPDTALRTSLVSGLLSLSLACGAAPSPQPAHPHALPTSSLPAETETQSAEQAAHVVDFANLWVQLVRTKNAQELQKHWWSSTFIDRMARAPGASLEERDYILKLGKSADPLTTILTGIDAETRYDLVRLRRAAGFMRLLCRLTSAGGVNYHEWLLDDTPGRPLRVVDFGLLTSNFQPFSSQLGEVFLAIRRFSQESFEAQLADPNRDYVLSMVALKDLRASSTAEPEKAIEIYYKLPIALQRDPRVLAMVLVSANAVAAAHKPEHQKLLDHLLDHLPAGIGGEFLALTLWQERHESRRLHVALGRLERALGHDAYLDAMRASTYLDERDFERARQAGLRGLRADPTFKDVHWVLFLTEVAARNYRAALVHARTLRDRFNLVATPVTSATAADTGPGVDATTEDASTEPQDNYGLANFFDSREYAEFLREGSRP